MMNNKCSGGPDKNEFLRQKKAAAAAAFKAFEVQFEGN